MNQALKAVAVLAFSVATARGGLPGDLEDIPAPQIAPHAPLPRRKPVQFKEPLVKQLDHLFIAASDSEGLHRVFTELFQLPEAWPYSDYGTSSSGGSNFGNINVESLKWTESQPGLEPEPGAAMIEGLAFEPNPPLDTQEECARRGIPVQQIPIKRGNILIAMNTLFGNISGAPERALVFISAYNPDVVDVKKRRIQLNQQLVERGGGPLGVEYVREIEVGALGFEKAYAEWAKVLGRPDRRGSWQLGPSIDPSVPRGPIIRLVRAEEAGIRKMVVKVRSLRTAVHFLRERGLLRDGGNGRAAIAIPGASGLIIELTERGAR